MNGAEPRNVRFAVVGLGHIAQVAVLPAFEHAEGCELVAVVSGDADKRREISQTYGLRHAVDYDGYEDLLDTGEVDVVYIDTPNHLHAHIAEVAAEHGVHVLCEKPMAVTEEKCRRMIHAAEENDVHLMIAYRLHFDPCSMEVAARVRRGDIGTPRFFVASFGQNVRAGDIRLDPIERGGGAAYDLGVYCVNAARYLFEAEPFGVTARSASSDDPRFDHCDETTSAILEFPGDRLASFTVSFGSADVQSYRIVGAEGEIRVEPAFSYDAQLTYALVVDGNVKERNTFPTGDQFAPELAHMAACVREDRRPEPDGREGLADIRTIRAIHRSAEAGERVRIDPVTGQQHPRAAQAVHLPPVRPQRTVKVKGPKR